MQQLSRRGNRKPKPSPPDDKPLYYPLTSDEWLKVSRELKPAEITVLYYLRTLDPFGDKYLDLGVREIASRLEMNPGTVSRALKVLDAKGYIDLELVSVRVKVNPVKTNVEECNSSLSTDNSVAYRQQTRSPDNNFDRQTTNSIATQHLNDRSDINPLQDEGFEPVENSSCTNNRSCSNSVKQQNTSPTTHPVKNEPGRIGTSIDTEILQGLLGAIQDAGIAPNKTIQKEVFETIQHLGNVEAVKHIRNAVTAVEEQMKQNKVRNPGGLLVKAIRVGFTSNGEKKKSNRDDRSAPQLPNLTYISTAIDQAIMNGDRAFAFGKLRQLWLEGLHEEARELCRLRRDWGFTIGTDGPELAYADGQVAR